MTTSSLTCSLAFESRNYTVLSFCKAEDVSRFRAFPLSRPKVNNSTGTALTNSVHCDRHTDLVFYAMWRSERHPLTPPHFLWFHGFFLQLWKAHWSHDWGRAVRQEVEWKPGLSTASLSAGPTARPSHCQQAQLGQAPRWPIVQWKLHMFTALRVSLRSPECVQNGSSLSKGCVTRIETVEQEHFCAVKSQH